MNKRRQIVLALGASALAAPLASFSQQQKKVARIGFLGSASAVGYAELVEALWAGLRDFGYFEGRNIAIEFRWAENNYERLPELAGELVRLKVDVIVTHGALGVRAARQASVTIPIVAAQVGDPVALGLVTSFARPGGNITGSTQFQAEISAKRLELLAEVVPRIRQMAILINPANPANEPNLRAMENTAASLKMGLQLFEAKGPADFESAFSAMAKKRVEAVTIIASDAIFIANNKAIADLATRHRLPSAGFKEFAEGGGLIGYGANLVEMFRRAAYFVDRILKGAKPGDLPIERASKFELVINMKTAKALGIKFPNSILLRADKVIE